MAIRLRLPIKLTYIGFWLRRGWGGGAFLYSTIPTADRQDGEMGRDSGSATAWDKRNKKPPKSSIQRQTPGRVQGS